MAERRDPQLEFTPAGIPRDALLAEYGEVNSNFRLLTDIRFKLLAFLPIVAAVGAAVAKAGTSNSDPLSEIAVLALSLFGLTVTIGLATYNDRNDQLYDNLVGRAATIERELGIPHGAFAHRLNAWFAVDLGLLRWKVGHRTGVTAIYLASIALWLAGLLVATTRLVWGSGDPPGWLYGLAVAAAVGLTLAGWLVVAHQRETRRARMREDARDAVRFVREHGRSAAAGCGMFQTTCARLHGSGDVEKMKRRADFYTDLSVDELAHYMETEPSHREAAQFVALLVDLPPHWIEDVARGRR
jgi:hypothetical protein